MKYKYYYINIIYKIIVYLISFNLNFNLYYFEFNCI